MPAAAPKREPSMRWPDLYKRNEAGAIQVWRVRVDPAADGAAFIVTEHGLLGGAVMTHSDRIAEGKLLGTKAERSPLQQAAAEALSKWTERKARKGYVESIEAAHAGARDALVTGGIEPMLAHTYGVLYAGQLTREQAHRARYPGLAQPKVDGHRIIAMVKNGKATLWSRKREQITGLPHIVAAIEASFPTGEWLLDGEGYIHGVSFEEIAGFIASRTPKAGYQAVQYHLFDLGAVPGSAWAKAPFTERYAALARQLGRAKPPLVLVETIPVASEAELLEAMRRWIAAGYEGVIFRNAAGLYANRRSYDLLKLKEFYDAEFVITGVVEGRGAMKGLAVFVCETPANPKGLPGAKPGMPGRVEFKAKMVGPLASLAVYFQHPERYIGKRLTVKYQGFYTKGAPRIAVALRIREE